MIYRCGFRECITSVNEEYQAKQNADVNVSALMTPEDQDDIIAVKTIHAEHDVVEALDVTTWR